MFFKKANYKMFAKTIVSTPAKIVKGSTFYEILTKEEQLFFDLELSFLMFFIVALKLQKKESTMLLEKELADRLKKVLPEGKGLIGGTITDIVRNRFQQYANAMNKEKDGDYAQAYETVFFAFFKNDYKQHMLDAVGRDLSSTITITSALNRPLFLIALNEIYNIVTKRFRL